jgi:hypothetical protein
MDSVHESGYVTVLRYSSPASRDISATIGPKILIMLHARRMQRPYYGIVGGHFRLLMSAGFTCVMILLAGRRLYFQTIGCQRVQGKA